MLTAGEADDREIAKTPDPDRKEQVLSLLRLAVYHVNTDDRIAIRARELFGLGFGSYDALHLACGKAAGANVFLTTDDKLLRRATRLAHELSVRVANPVQWLPEQRT